MPSFDSSMQAIRNIVSPRLIPISYFIVLVFACVGAISFSHAYSLSSFMLWDDNLYLARGLMGAPLPYPPQPFHHMLIDFLTASGDIRHVKFLPLLTFGLLAGAIFLLLQRFSSGVLIPGLLALIITLYPISVDQTFYVIGTHPSFGAMLAFYALYFFSKGWRAPGVSGPAHIGVSGLLCLLAALSSPMLTLATVAPLTWLMVALCTDRISARPIAWRRAIVCAAALLVPLVIHLMHGMFRNVYDEGGDSRINVSIGNIAPALGNAFETIIAPLSSWHMATATGFVLVAALSAIVSWFVNALRSPNSTRPELDLPVMALILSALSFAPNIAVASEYFRTRYITAPFAAGMVCIALIVVQAVADKRQKPMAAALIVLAPLLFVSELFRASAMINAGFGEQLATHQAVLQTVEKEKSTWSNNASVLFIVQPGVDIHSWQLGVPEWSTAGLRYLSGKTELRAMIAPTDWLRNSLRSDREEGDRDVTRLIGRILGKIGLEGDAPLFVYRSDALGKPFEGTSLVFLDSLNTGHVIGSGARATSAAARKFDLFSNECDPIDEFVVFVAKAPSAEDVNLRMYNTPKSWSFPSAHYAKESVVPKEGELFLLQFTMRSAGMVPAQKGVSITYPPMPLRAYSKEQSLGVYQVGGVYTVLYDRGERRRWSVNGALREVEMSLYGRQGCRVVLSLDGKMLDFLPGGEMIPDWILGKGVQQRSWAGEIENWTFYKEN